MKHQYESKDLERASWLIEHGYCEGDVVKIAQKVFQNRQEDTSQKWYQNAMDPDPSKGLPEDDIDL